VDYEACLLGNVVIGRRTGGLAKVRHCAYLYDWLDMGDRAGEREALLQQVRAAVQTYRGDPGRHRWLVRLCMAIDAGWRRSADQYLDLYAYGELAARWHEERRDLIRQFVSRLGPDRALFKRFFAPAHGEYSDPLNWDLRHLLNASPG